jgi:flagellar basal body rod protein FlgG
MHDALFAAASGMRAVARALDMATHNAANARTPGYRARVPRVSSFATALEQAAGRRGSLVTTEETTASGQGFLVDGESPLSVALQGEGFFALRAPSGVVYTRNGDFRLAADGTLRGVGGLPVLAGGEPVRLDLSGEPPSIDAEGNVMQGGLSRGRLDVVEFGDEGALIRESDLLFRAPPGADAREATRTRLVPGMLEMPDKGGVTALVGMIAASRAFEASQRVIGTVNQTMERALRNRG